MSARPDCAFARIETLLSYSWLLDHRHSGRGRLSRHVKPQGSGSMQEKVEDEG